MRILITGASGFIGSYLAPELERRGHTVTGVDRSGNGIWRDLAASRIRDLLEQDRPDLVIHLAAAVGIVNCEKELSATIAGNAIMTGRLAQDCGELGVKVAYTSTSEVYGADGSWSEDDPLPPQKNIYGLTKRWGEDVLRMYTDDPYIFRLSMPYGPGTPPGPGRRSLDNFLWQALHGMPIVVHRGAGRSWCWVEDAVRGMADVLEKTDGGIWNIGRDDAYLEMRDLAHLCCLLTGADFGIVEEVDPPAIRTMGKRLRSDKLRGIGWKPTVELPEGLPRMLDWVRQFDRDGRYIPQEEAA